MSGHGLAVLQAALYRHPLVAADDGRLRGIDGQDAAALALDQGLPALAALVLAQAAPVTAQRLRQRAGERGRLAHIGQRQGGAQPGVFVVVKPPDLVPVVALLGMPGQGMVEQGVQALLAYDGAQAGRAVPYLVRDRDALEVIDERQRLEGGGVAHLGVDVLLALGGQAALVQNLVGLAVASALVHGHGPAGVNDALLGLQGRDDVAAGEIADLEMGRTQKPSHRIPRAPHPAALAGIDPDIAADLGQVLQIGRVDLHRRAALDAAQAVDQLTPRFDGHGPLGIDQAMACVQEILAGQPQVLRAPDQRAHPVADGALGAQHQGLAGGDGAGVVQIAFGGLQGEGGGRGERGGHGDRGAADAQGAARLGRGGAGVQGQWLRGAESGVLTCHHAGVGIRARGDIQPALRLDAPRVGQRAGGLRQQVLRLQRAAVVQMVGLHG